MKKIITIGDKEVELNNNVAWVMEYRDQFGKDIVPSLMPLLATMVEGLASVVSEAGGEKLEISALASAVEGRAMEILLPMFQIEMVDVVINVTWAMAKAADDNILPPKQWVKQFEEFPLDVVVPNVYELILKGFVSSKNLIRLKKLGASLKDLQPSN